MMGRAAGARSESVRAALTHRQRRPRSVRGAAIETIDLDGADPMFTVVLDDETLNVDGAIRHDCSTRRTMAGTAAICTST